MLVALAALLMSIYTAYRGSSGPSEDARLRVQNHGQGEFSLAISNTGARSAIVDGMQILASVNDRDREYCDVTDDSAADDNRAEPFVIKPGDITLHNYSLPDPDMVKDCFRDVKASEEPYRAHLLVHTTDWQGRRPVGVAPLHRQRAGRPRRAARATGRVDQHAKRPRRRDDIPR